MTDRSSKEEYEAGLLTIDNVIRTTVKATRTSRKSSKGGSQNQKKSANTDTVRFSVRTSINDAALFNLEDTPSSHHHSQSHDGNDDHPRKSGRRSSMSSSHSARSFSSKHVHGDINIEQSTVSIPGNAKASATLPTILVTENPDADETEQSAGGYFPTLGDVLPSVLQMQAMRNSGLQTGLRQQQSIVRLASVRHSMAVKAAGFHYTPQNVKTHAGTSLDDGTTSTKPRSFMGYDWPPQLPTKPTDKNAFIQGRKRFTVVTRGDQEDSSDDAQMKSKRERAFEEGWETVTNLKANDLHSVTKYRSKKTGFEVVHAKLASPTVHGYFVIATKCENDWGLPHILEHLIFLGSRSFPYPHVLDKLSSKCFAASGTNAWTDSDHSCFTLVTAGKAGFLTLLPVYLDHIFFPTLSEAGYITEVHHISGECKDGGAVYLEMQSIEHDPLEQANWTLLREIYTPESGYYYNYGGSCIEIRDNCTPQSARAFHKKYYHPRNACLVICGDLDRDEFLSIIDPFLQAAIDNKAVPETWTKPWISEPAVQLAENIDAIVHVPSETEGHVLVKIGIVGPSVTEDVNRAVGMNLLMQYLLDSPVAPVQLEFVEKQDAISSHVHLTEITHTQKIFCINFESIPEEKMRSVPAILKNLLVRQCTGEFDPERMEFIVNHCYQKELSAMENAAEETIAHAVIADFLYETKEDGLMFDRRVNMAYTIEQFHDQSADFWIRMIQTLLDTKWATVYAVPSEETGDLYAEQELERENAIREKLGEVGLRKLGSRLEAATNIMARPAPQNVFDSVSTPSIASIGYLGLVRHSNPSWASDTLCNIYLDDINSSYVYLTVHMDTSELTLEEKKYLVLFAEAILESPYVDSSGNFYTYEQTIAGLNRDVLKYESFFGVDWDGKEGTRFSCGSYSHIFCIRFQLEMKKVKEGFEWMQLILWNTKWQASRLKIIAQRMANEVTHLLDQGSTMAQAILVDCLYRMGSNVKSLGLIRQQLFLQRVANELPKSFKKVAKKLEAIRMCILRPENTTVHIGTCLPKMEFYLTDKPEVTDAIGQLLRRTFDYTGWQWGYETKRLANSPDYNVMKGVDCITKCVVERCLRMHSDEGSYLAQAAPCVNSYNDPEYPVVLTTMMYFCQVDGPFYKAVKATGFATAYHMKVKPNEGMVYFELKHCSDLVSAYCGAFDIIVSHLDEMDGRRPKEEAPLWNETLLETAKSSVIFELIENENTPFALSMKSLIDYYHEVPADFRTKVMERVTNVTMDEVKKITKKYLRALFVEVSSCAVAAPKEKVPRIIKGLMDHCAKRLSLLPPVHQSEMATFF